MVSKRGTLASLRLELMPVVKRLPAYSRLGLALIKERRIGRLREAALVGGMVYLLSPIDLVPGIVPGLGQLDDLALVLFALKMTLRLAPQEVAAHHMAAAGLTWEVIDQDLARVGRSAGIIARAALRLAGRVTSAAARNLWQRLQGRQR